MEPLEAVGWLLSYAIAMEYEDFSGSANNAPVLESIRGGEEEVAAAAAPQAGDESLAAEADRLAALLGLQRLAVDASGAVENDAALLSRCNKTIRLYFSNQVAEGGKAGASTSRGQAPPPMPLESFPLGFSMGDTVLDQAAVVLKMLYLFDFRELQDDLNNVIILGQEYTANPKTNASLGKVGR
jgi:RLL motif containing protein 1